MNVDIVVERKIKRSPVNRNSTNKINENHYTFLLNGVFGATPRSMEAVALFGGQAPHWGGLVTSEITVFGMWTAQDFASADGYPCLPLSPKTFTYFYLSIFYNKVIFLSFFIFNIFFIVDSITDISTSPSSTRPLPHTPRFSGPYCPRPWVTHIHLFSFPNPTSRKSFFLKSEF